MSGGVPLRSVTAVAALSLLALAGFGSILAFEVPVTPDEAMVHAEDVSHPGDVYLWKCPTPNGSYVDEQLELDVPISDASDILRVPTVFVQVPILLVDYDDPYVMQVAEHILSVTEGYDDYYRIAAALCFVQTSISYTSDQELYGTHEFWATPRETLHHRAGDCEDTSVLLVSILGAMGYEPVLLDYEGHEAVGVRRGDNPSLDHDLFCETTYDTPTMPSYGTPGNPDEYVPGDTSPVDCAVNGLIASYRDMIRRVAGT